MHITCPHCGHRATIRTSKAITKVTREGFCQCTNLACGHTFVAVTEVVRTISPSAVPDPLIASQLQQSQRAIEIRERDAAGSAAAG
ncbi:MAG: transcriptional regulator [Candidatus Accumulibacter sp. 66-26]|nr:ogr/Delta-like zinc finger family protein [Accumulibacter sp.]OJW46049.1 MAG: transcriptional regulator [Candidatus Accumulibacter sp. 66-26]